MQVMSLVHRALALDSRLAEDAADEIVRGQDEQTRAISERGAEAVDEDASLEGLRLESRACFDDALNLYAHPQKYGVRDAVEPGIVYSGAGVKSSASGIGGHADKWRADSEYVETLLDAYRSANIVLH